MQAEAYTLDATRTEMDMMLKALEQWLPFLDEPIKYSKDDIEHLERLRNKLREALRLI